MVKPLVVVVIAVAVIAVVLPTCFPGFTKRSIFTAIFYKEKYQLKYFPEPDTPPDRSPGARALQKILSSKPIEATLDIKALRQNIDSLGDLNPLASDAIVTRANITDQLFGYWVTIKGESEEMLVNGTVILYLHGGGYIAGSLVSHGGWVAELIRRTHGRGFFLEYRLAPENKLPAATEDAIAAYRWLIGSQKVNPKQIAIIGDSAGGGLTLLTLLAMNEKGAAIPLPGAAVALSPFADLALKQGEIRPSWTENKGKDMVGNLEETRDMVFHITGLSDPEKRKSPKFSPIYANLETVKFPPLLLTCGGDESIRDDSVHFYGKALQAGLDVTLKNYKYMVHIFQFFWPWLEEAETGLNDIVQFVREHTTN